MQQFIKSNVVSPDSTVGHPPIRAMAMWTRHAKNGCLIGSRIPLIGSNPFDGGFKAHAPQDCLLERQLVDIAALQSDTHWLDA